MRKFNAILKKDEYKKKKKEIQQQKKKKTVPEVSVGQTLSANVQVVKG